jgi:hypothetical protein
MVDLVELRGDIPEPHWSVWKNKLLVTLNQAILLSMNVCPHRYETRDDPRFLDMSVYLVPNRKIIKDITRPPYFMIFSQYQIQLKDAQSWASRVDWIESELTGAGLLEDNLVDLRKFSKWACQDVEWFGIPNEFFKIARIPKSSDIKTSIPVKKISIQHQNDQILLQAIKEFGYDHLALPRQLKYGNRTIKADISDHFTKSGELTFDVFENSWRRLKGEGKIKSS